LSLNPIEDNTLFTTGPQRIFTGSALQEIAFPLGGIGAGTISLGGRGNLRDFEIFGHPDKGRVLPFTFFALWAQAAGEKPVAKILEGHVPAPYRNGFGEPQAQLLGVSRFAEAAFRGEYPTAILELSDPAMPVRATLTAWNPFIPLNVRDSALPAAIFAWTFTNPGAAPVELSLAASLTNPCTMLDVEGHPTSVGATNAYYADNTVKGLVCAHPAADPHHPDTGTLALTTSWPTVDVQTHWYRGGWWDACHLFWDAFSAQGRLSTLTATEPSPRTGETGTLTMRATVPSGGTVTIPVILTWHFAHLRNPWQIDGSAEVLPTYAGAHFSDAWAVARYLHTEYPRLQEETDRWRTAIFTSSLPTYVLEAITSQASILRSPTCFLLADGALFGWEGCSDTAGCCHGNCTHVWNYEQAVAFLFPELERTMRRTEFLYNTRDTGNMAFRTHLPLGANLQDFKPCADGQMGTIVQVYRDWQLSGDDAFLREIWPAVKRALEYAWTMTPDRMDLTSGSGVINAGDDERRSIDSLWDPDKDGVMEGEQHNTYDIEFFGPNTMCTALYLAALRAGEELARYLGEPEKAEEYRQIFASGRRIVDAELWNGEYYTQQVTVIPEVTVPAVLRSPDSACGPTCACKQSPGGTAAALSDAAAPKYQYGDGCLSDQLVGQLAAHVAGLGYLLDPARVRTAVKSIFTHNYRAPIGNFSNVQRVYALNDEAGLLLCSWPHGNRPALPFVYCDEVWTGIEYQVAAHLIYEGWLEEGLQLVKAVTDRYAGHNRNPWNEVECGHHYARAMASWSVKLALDGFTYSLPDGRLGFAPRLRTANYRTFWSTGTGWGTLSVHWEAARATFQVGYGRQTLRCLALTGFADGPLQVVGPCGPLAARREGDTIILHDPILLQAGDALVIVTKYQT